VSTQSVFAAHAREASQHEAAQHKKTNTKPSLLIAGGAGALGSAVLERVCGSGLWRSVTVYTQGHLHSSLGALDTLSVDELAPDVKADAGIIVFDHARNFHERERRLWMPAPHDLLSTAQRMQAQGVRSLAVVVPYLQASLPQALKAGLVSLDEQVLNAMCFERLLIIRPAHASQKLQARHALDAVAHWMLSQLRYMIPEHERPVRAIKLAAFTDAALHAWINSGKRGTKVVAPEVLWQAAAASDMASYVKAWLEVVHE
jgi:hypothetical protein